MSRRPKSVFSFSKDYFEMVEACALRGKKYEIPNASLTEARRTQGKFYHFRQALGEAVKIALSRPDSVEAAQLGTLRDALQFAQSTVCWFDLKAAMAGERVSVWFMNKSETPDAQLLAAAIKREKAESGELEPTDLDAEAEASAERVKALLEKDPPKKNPYY
jgi:hypothetical protein